MINPQAWVPDVLHSLKQVFGERLRYCGLQGSYRRGEATEDSDIDIVVLLDAVSLDCLDVYRGIVRTMPEGHKACGFICGVRDFYSWPRHELFPFKMDTTDFYGRLDDFIPPVSKDDIACGVRISASALLHFLTHSYLYTDTCDRRAILKDAFKSAFFIMLVANYLASGVYRNSKKELLANLTGAERDIIAAGMDLPGWLKIHSEKEVFGMLLDWCRGVLNSVRSTAA